METKYFYKLQDKIYYITEQSNEMKIITVAEKSKDNSRWFEMGKDSATVESLIKFKEEFNRCNDEIKEYTNGNTDYKHRYNDGFAIMGFFRSKSTRVMNSLAIENVSALECVTFEKCFNAGICRLNPDYIAKPIQCYGHDFSNCYGTFLSNFDVSQLWIPKKVGRFTMIDELNIMDLDDLKYGIYHVEISSEDPIITTYFEFSTDHWYTLFSLQQLQRVIKFATKYYKKNKERWVEPKIVLQTDGAHNALVYRKKDCVQCNVVFGEWNKVVTKMKKDLKGNFLVKNLSSKLWGYLTQFNRTFMNEDEIADVDYAYYDDITEDFTPEYMCVGESNINTDHAKYQLIKTDNPYKQGGIARIKPFLVSSIRKYITDMILDSGLHDNVVRICTDGICLDESHDFSDDYDYYPIPEQKTTGYIKYYNANNYMHVCKKCKHEWKYSKDFVHKCQ
jgi:hypothetical protein